MKKVEIHFAPGHLGLVAGEHPVVTALRIIATGFSDDENEWADKYGINFENDVFLMHKDCWCEQDDCPWCLGCRCPQGNWEKRKGERWPVKVRKTCYYCTESGIFERFRFTDGSGYSGHAPYYNPPNFWYKPYDLRIKWYKYIGRSMETSGGYLPWDWLDHVFASHPAGMTVEQATAKCVRNTEAAQESFAQAMERATGARD